MVPGSFLTTIWKASVCVFGRRGADRTAGRSAGGRGVSGAAAWEGSGARARCTGAVWPVAGFVLFCTAGLAGGGVLVDVALWPVATPLPGRALWGETFGCRAGGSCETLCAAACTWSARMWGVLGDWLCSARDWGALWAPAAVAALVCGARSLPRSWAPTDTPEAAVLVLGAATLTIAGPCWARCGRAGAPLVAPFTAGGRLRFSRPLATTGAACPVALDVCSVAPGFWAAAPAWEPTGTGSPVGFVAEIGETGDELDGITPLDARSAKNWVPESIPISVSGGWAAGSVSSPDCWRVNVASAGPMREASGGDFFASAVASPAAGEGRANVVSNVRVSVTSAPLKSRPLSRWRRVCCRPVDPPWAGCVGVARWGELKDTSGAQAGDGVG